MFGIVFNLYLLQINEERYGKQIDPKLLQDVMSIFLEIGKNTSPSYYENFEQAMLEETAAFYSQLSSQWVLYDSLTDYIQKVSLLFNPLGFDNNYWILYMWWLTFKSAGELVHNAGERKSWPLSTSHIRVKINTGPSFAF